MAGGQDFLEGVCRVGRTCASKSIEERRPEKKRQEREDIQPQGLEPNARHYLATQFERGPEFQLPVDHERHSKSPCDEQINPRQQTAAGAYKTQHRANKSRKKQLSKGDFESSKDVTGRGRLSANT